MIKEKRRQELLIEIDRLLLNEKGMTPYDAYGILDSVKVAFIGSVLKKANEDVKKKQSD